MKARDEQLERRAFERFEAGRTLTMMEVAAVLGVDRHTLYVWGPKGPPFVRVSEKGPRRYLAGELRAWIEKNQRQRWVNPSAQREEEICPATS